MKLNLDLFVLFLVMFLLSTTTVHGAVSGQQCSNQNVVFFGNGVWNTPQEAASSTLLLKNKLNPRLGDQAGKTLYFAQYNPTGSSQPYTYSDTLVGMLLDVWETATQLNDSHYVEFWRKIFNLESLDEEMAAYVKQRVLETTQQPLSNPVIQKHVDKYNFALNLGYKIVVVAHSQGNLFANFAYPNIEEKYRNAFGIVSVANPASYTAGGGPYTTIEEDSVISIIPNHRKALVNNFSLTETWWLNDPFGHGFGESYMAPGHQAETEILTNTVNMLNTLEIPCTKCGEPLQDGGGQTVEMHYPYEISNKIPQNLTIAFEAFTIPDRLRVLARGNVLYDTKTAVSGFHTKTVAYDPAIHGDFLDVYVNAPTAGTKWQLCVNCGDPTNECDLVGSRKSVDLWTTAGSYHCPSGPYIDGNAGLPNMLSVGEHTFSWKSGDSCWCGDGASCNNGDPSLNVKVYGKSTVTIPLAFVIQRKFTIDNNGNVTF